MGCHGARLDDDDDDDDDSPRGVDIDETVSHDPASDALFRSDHASGCRESDSNKPGSCIRSQSDRPNSRGSVLNGSNPRHESGVLNPHQESVLNPHLESVMNLRQESVLNGSCCRESDSRGSLSNGVSGGPHESDSHTGENLSESCHDEIADLNLHQESDASGSCYPESDSQGSLPHESDSHMGENHSESCHNEITESQVPTTDQTNLDLMQVSAECSIKPAMMQSSIEAENRLNQIYQTPQQGVGYEKDHSIVKVLNPVIYEQPCITLATDYDHTTCEEFSNETQILNQHSLPHLPSSSSRGYEEIDIINPMERMTANQIQVQNAFKMAREKIQQLVTPKDAEKQMGNHLFDRFMAHIKNKKLSYILHISALFLVSMYKKAYQSKPWRSALKEIEGNFGSAVMLTFCFLRFVFILNAVLTVLWMVVIVIPFFLDPPASFSWSKFFGAGFSNFFQGNGIEKSWIFYGGYYYTSEEQTGWYKTAYMYPCTIIVSLLISWILILTRITRRLSVTNKILVSTGTATHPFCTAVFGSWDFGIMSMDAASRLRKGIRMRFREMLADVTTQEKQFLRPITKSRRYKRYLALGVLWPLQIAGNVAIVITLVSQSDRVNQKLKTDYAQSILLTAVSMISPLSIPFLVKLEDWTPAKSEHVVLMKLFSLRLVNVCTLFARLYMALAQATTVRSGNQILSCKSHKSCPEGFACCNTAGGNEWVFCTQDQGNVCMPGCMENAVAKQLLRLILTGTVVNILCDFVYGLIYKRFFHAQRQLSIENLVIDIVYIESLVWVGSSFSPVAAFLGLFCNFLTFSYMKFSLRQFYGPMKNPYSASRTSNLTHGLLLLTLILCSLPASVTLVQKSSGACGPIAKDSSMYQAVSSYIEQTPAIFRVIVQWIGNPVILVGVILLLVFGVILLKEELVQNRVLFQARYNMFTAYCLLALNDERQHEKIKCLSKQVSSIS